MWSNTLYAADPGEDGWGATCRLLGIQCDGSEALLKTAGTQTTPCMCERFSIQDRIEFAQIVASKRTAEEQRRGQYFRFLRRALSIKRSYYSRISNERVWKAAGKPYIPSQKILEQQFKLLIQCVTTPPTEPFHHVVFVPGYKDRVKFTKSKSRGHPARYWFELVSKEAVRFRNHYLDYHALTGRSDFLGLKQLLQNALSLVSTWQLRLRAERNIYSKTVGSAWQS